MRSLLVFFVITVVFLIYGSINYYIGLKGWNALIKYIPFLNKRVYWIIFWLIVAAYPVGQFAEKYIPVLVGRWLTIVGAYWLAAMFYFLLIILFLDAVRLLDKWLGFIPESIKESAAPVTGAIVFTIVVGLLVYGSWNALNPKVSYYQITVNKKVESIEQLHIVMVSDIHLGSIVRTGRLNKLAETVNERKPDLIVLAGDIVDQTMEPAEVQALEDLLGKMESKLGKFAVPGNHEYISGYINKAVNSLEKAGFHVLRDQNKKVADSFYVVGREDGSGHRMNPNNEGRMELSQLLENIDHSMPIISIDHQPIDIENARKLGVDLQLSGHTHNGQMFPNNFITGLIYEEDWGLWEKDGFNLIVSSGYGTWGPPIRIGNHPEIVDVIVKFK